MSEQQKKNRRDDASPERGSHKQQDRKITSMSPMVLASGLFLAVGFGGSCWLMYHYWKDGHYVPLLWWASIAGLSLVACVFFGLYDWAVAQDGIAAESRRAATTQQQVVRPWVMIKAITFHVEEGKPFKVTMEFRNTGPVPATDIAQKWRNGIQTGPLKLSAMPPLQLRPDSVLGLLSPGLVAFGDSKDGPVITKPILDDLKVDRAGAYSYGVLEYRMAGADKNLPPFVTGFCFKATPTDLAGPPLMYGGSEGNYAR